MSPPCIDTGGLAHVLGYQLALADIPARRVFAQHIGEPMGLKPVEFTILLLVAANPGVTQKQLGQALAVSAPHLTLLIDRLASKGHVARVRGCADRRVQNLSLTPAGQALAERAHATSFTMERELLRPLSDGERAMLLELLNKVAGARKSGG